MKKEETLARNFLDHAKEFRDAGRRLAETKPFLYHPSFYCAIHSLELAIKAHLALAGVPKRRLSARVLGHNLAALLKESELLKIADTLQLNSHDRHNISLGSSDYSGRCFEYPELLYSTFPIGVWLRWADNVIDGFPKHEEDAQDVPPNASPAARSAVMTATTIIRSQTLAPRSGVGGLDDLQ